MIREPWAGDRCLDMGSGCTVYVEYVCSNVAHVRDGTGIRWMVELSDLAPA